jgi:CRISPR-associated protein Cas1
MSESTLRTDGSLEAQPRMGVRNLHNFIYCPRLFYFQWVENIFQENADTVAGSHVHRNVDAPSKLDDPKELGLPEGAKLRSLRLESESLGLIGVVDIVEGGPDGAEIIDYKRGSARRDGEGERVAKEPDAMQVAAHALLLREHGVNAVRGAVYYAADKRRVPVEFSEELFSKVRKAIDDARAVAASGKCPPPLKNDARCLYCSAYPICLPNESLWWSKRRKPADADGQIQFGFIAQSEDAVRSQILAALDFAAESTDKEPTLQPPRPGGDDGEVLVVQTPGAQIGQRGDELLVSVKGEDVRKLPGQQVRAIYCYGAVQITAQAVSTCLELGIDVSYFSPAGRFLGMLGGLPASGVDARRGQYCHRSLQNQPVGVESKPATLRRGFHNRFMFGCKVSCV